MQGPSTLLAQGLPECSEPEACAPDTVQL